MKDLRVPLERLHEFDEIVDARTPLEFADDHIPGAINAPVLDNAERVIIGTLYKTAPFEATRLGAAMVARNISRHLDTLFADRPRHWQPLIYCWRGGKRSGSMTTWFDLIGWRARQLDGGYKIYRRWVIDTLAVQPLRLRYIVLLGHTGSGKTRLLQALGKAGAQILDLEELAAHRGSLLGALPGRPQPSQKGFDTALAATLARLDPSRPVFVEAESRKIGAITLPDALLEGMHRGECINVHTQREDRIAFLLQDYGHLFDTPEHFNAQLARLIGLHSKQTVTRWQQMVENDERATLFEELIGLHYDPAYSRSSGTHFSAQASAMRFDFVPTSVKNNDSGSDHGDEGNNKGSTEDAVAQAGRLLKKIASRT